jgi:hypothetical protein
MTLADLIAGGESLAVEFKKDANDHDLVEAVVCLANAQGGTLLVGVDDDGRVVSARPRHGTTADPRRIEAMVSSSSRPSVGVRAELTEEAARGIQSDLDRARAVLSRLVEAGILDARGERRGRFYHLSAAMYRVLRDRAAYVRFAGAILDSTDGFVLAARCRRDDSLRRSRETRPDFEDPGRKKAIARVRRAVRARS